MKLKGPGTPLPPRKSENVAQPAWGRGLAVWQGTVAALQIRDYRWYWLGVLASFLGMQMQWPTQAWLAYELTGSALMLGLMSAGWAIPMVTLSLFGGALADRMQKRDLLIVGQMGLGLANLVVAVLISLGVIQFWHLFAAALASGVMFALTMPARQAIVPELVPRGTLMNAIALSSGAMNVCRVLGPALAGVFIAAVGTQGAYYAAVGCTAVAAGFLALLPPTSTTGEQAKTSVFGQIIQGLRYVRGHTLVLTLLGMEAVLVLFGMPYQSLMPVFAELLNVEALGYGFLMAMAGVGAAVGSLVVASLGDFQRKGLLLLGFGICFGVTLLVFANAGSLSLSLFVLTLVGASSTGFMAINTTLIQMNISDEVRGRVMSVYMMTFGLSPLGTLPAGAIAEAVGAPFAVTLGGGILAGVVLTVALLRPRLWRLQ